MAPNTAATSPADPVIVCGLGQVGYHICQLLARLNVPYRIITRAISERLPLIHPDGLPILLGDARDELRLHEAGIKSAKVLLAVTNDDMVNVAIALEARRLNPHLRIVIRLFDQDLASHLEPALGIHRALSASSLSAPAFVAACLEEATSGAFEFEGARFVIQKQSREAPPQPAVSTARSAIIACSDGSQVTFAPGAEHTSNAAVKCTGLRVMDSPLTAQESGRASSRTSLFGAWRSWPLGLKAWWAETPAALRAVLGALGGIVVFSVLLFRLAMGLTLVDACYFVVTIITTVGFGDLNFLNASPALKLYGAFLMVCGAAMIAVLFSIISDMVLSTRLGDLWSRRCSNATGHVIVAGLGNLGYRVLNDLLSQGQTVVAIEQNEEAKFLAAARGRVPVVIGNARAEETLIKAGVRGAHAIISVTNDDIANLSIGLAVKRLNPQCRAVLRLFDACLAAKMPTSLGVDTVLSIAAAAAPAFVSMALADCAQQGFILGNFLVVLFKGSGLRASTEIAQGQTESSVNIRPAGEMALFARASSTRLFLAVPPDYEPRPDEIWIGARWFHLSKDGLPC
jgi:Trk K+ transport system NAD-binding subunit